MKNNKKNTPLVCCLKKYSRGKNLRMHMPCHQARLGFLPDAEQLDVTELGFNDNLNSPDGVIADSQRLFAELFGAKQAHFLTNGSSQGIFAFLGLLAGKTLLVEKDAHVSVNRGAKLFGVKLLFVETITKEVVEQNIEKHFISGVLVRFPDYFGKIVDLKGIYQKTSQNNVLLFVDGAHGAHFGLSKYLPYHPVGYCDACVVSTHKTLGAFTQTAVILTQNEKIGEQLKKTINLTSTTSPSYVLMASIDYARDYADRFAEKKLDELYANVKAFCQKLPSGLKALPTDDFCKLCLDFGRIGISGETAFKFLAKRGIFAELYKGDCVLFYLGIFTTKADLNKLQKALKFLVKQDFSGVEQKRGDGPFEFGE